MFERFWDSMYIHFENHQWFSMTAASVWSILELVTLTGLRMAFGARARLKTRSSYK